MQSNILFNYITDVLLQLTLLINSDLFCIGNPSCYTNGTYTWYLGYCFMQKIERLVALGNRITVPFQIDIRYVLP